MRVQMCTYTFLNFVFVSAWHAVMSSLVFMAFPQDGMVTLDPVRSGGNADSVQAKIAARRKPGQDLRGLS
jgi:hypothetical protein